MFGIRLGLNNFDWTPVALIREVPESSNRVQLSRINSAVVPQMEQSRIRISPGRLATFALLQLLFAASAYAQSNNATSKRVVYYFARMFDSNGTYISLLPVIANESLNKHGKPYTTDILAGEWHVGQDPDGLPYIHLNNLFPNNTNFTTFWNETAILQSKGVNINLFMGGYLDTSFINLAANFSTIYPVLKETIQTYNFDGIELDVEDSTETTAEIEQLITQLSSDFGPDFIITLAPVATDLQGLGGLSNIDYKQLYKDMGSNISWFNVQFYSGFGTLASPDDYEAVVENGFPPGVVVAGMLSNYNGQGFVNITDVGHTVKSLVKKFPNFGGVDAWEYFNSLPGGPADPARWATYFGKVMK